VKKEYLKYVLQIAIVIFLGLFVLDKIPFHKEVSKSVSAEIYFDDEKTEETVIEIKGEKTNYIFGENEEFYGKFYIPQIEKTGREYVNTIIEWNEENYQFIRFNSAGDMIIAEEMGIVPYIIINEEMTEFAVLLTDERVIATSEELYNIITKHISWNKEKTSVSINDIETIPKI